jgi:RNA polymerase sigma factor (sigma-70 family)
MIHMDKGKFLTENRGLINKAANKFFFETPKFSFDDLVSVGNQGALRAFLKFDPERKVKFTTYVYRAACREIRDFVRKNKFDIRVTFYEQNKHFKAVKSGDAEGEYSGVNSPIAIRLDKEFDENPNTSLRNVLPSGAPPPEQNMMLMEQNKILMNEINCLPERDKDIIIERHVEGCTFSEIGDRHGISRERVRQIEGRIIKSLRNKLIPKLGNFIVREDGLARKTLYV